MKTRKTISNIIKNIRGEYVILFIFMILAISCKKNYHVDEMFSYGLANHVGKIAISIDEGKRYEPAEEMYLNYLCVHEGNGLNYSNVWENQRNDVHPPLYYALLHTICGFFSGSFSRWYAGSINIVFAIATLFYVKKISKLLIDNKIITTAIAVLFAVSPAIISASTFLRMYVMAMFFVTILTYILLDSIGKNYGWKLYIYVFLSVLAGALTHYYCVIYVCAISLLYVIYLVYMKKYWVFMGYAGTLMLAAGAALKVFPAMWTHVFHGYRGTEVINNLENASLDIFVERVIQYFNLINEQLFGGILGYIILTSAILLFIIKFSENKDGISYLLNIDRNTGIRYGIVLGATIIYFVFVAKMSPYITDRYMVPIYAVLLVSILSVLGVLLNDIQSRKVQYLAISILSAGILISSYDSAEWKYLYKSSSEILDWADEHRDVDCIYVYDTDWKMQPSYMEIAKYNSVTCVQRNNLELLDSLECNNYSSLVLLIIGDEVDIIEEINEKFPNLNNYEKIGEYGYATTYYLWAE